MKPAIIVLALGLTPLLGEASTRTLSAVGEKATVDLAQVSGNPKKYYVRLTEVDSPLAGQVVIIDRTQLGRGGEEFITEGLGFNLRLGGEYERLKTNPPIIGVLNFQGRKINLRADERAVDLAADYKVDECIQERTKSEAQVELDTAMENVRKTCGGQLQLNVEWGKFPDAGRACNGREFLEALAYVCKDGDYKSALAPIKKIVVAMGQKAFWKEGATLYYNVPEIGENTFVRSRLWLEDNL